MIGIRVDANEKIAMGHLMRCMSIAKQLKKQNQKVIFILSEEYAVELILENEFEYICLNNRYWEKEAELEQLISFIQQNRISKLLLDSYEVTYKYMEELYKYCQIIYIDDMNNFTYPVDMIINYTYGAEISQYMGKGYKKETFLLGSVYVPLRPEFAGESICIMKDIKGILITTGGTDEYDMIVDILVQMEDMQHIKKYVVVGKFYKNLKVLEEMVEKDSTIEIYQDITDIHKIMQKCDMAISAGGTTLAELCACGIPTICFSVADNQLAGTRAYSDAGMMIYAGDARNDKKDVISGIRAAMEMLKNNVMLREKMSKKAKEKIDGQGAMRIAKEIINL